MVEQTLKVDTLNIRHLRAFCAVGQSGSISAAERMVFLSQPAITQAISKLERRLGIQLFNRHHSGMFLTGQGELMYRRVDRGLRLIDLGAQAAIKRGKRRSGSFDHVEQLMTAVQMRALVAVARHGNFSVAAREVGTSQPSLHRAARELEKLVGVALFERVSNGIVLTRAAEILQRAIRLGYAEFDQGIDEANAQKLGDISRVSIGTMPLAQSFLLPTALLAFSRQRPDVKIRIVEGPYESLMHGLRHGEIDLVTGALRLNLDHDDVIQETLFADSLAVVCRIDHPLTGRDQVEVQDLVNYGWVVPVRGAPTRDYVEAMFAAHSLQLPAQLIETGSSTLIRGLLSDSNRLSIMSEHQINLEQQAGTLTRLAMSLPPTDRQIGLTMRRDWLPTANQSLLLQELRRASADLPGI